MSKRILSIVLMLTLVLGSFSMAFAADAPKDVVGTDIEDAVARLGKLGILTGYDDGEFKPKNDIKRSEFAAVVSRARGLEQAAENSKGNTVFFDVPTSHWASGYVKVADDAGIIKGMGVIDGKNYFRPDRNISYEQAVTLVVRALGYEPEAQKNGGYPNGHLIVASQTGLLKNIQGNTGANATRGLVAQLVDNALDIAKMIDVGYGHIVSGTSNTEEKFLFDDMGFDRILDGVIKEADSDKNKVVISGYKEKDQKKPVTKSLKVESDFNFAGLEGLKVTAWYNDKTDKLVDVKVKSDYETKFDAIEVTKEETKSKKAEIKLITEDKKYDVDEDAVVRINGNKKDASDLKKNVEYKFAKLVLNEYNDVSWVEAYDLDEMIVVEEVEKDILKGYDNKEIDKISDFTIIKDGEQITSDKLDKEDILLYHDKEEYAAVVTNTKTDEIERVYKDGFKFDGEIYNFDNSYDGVKYIVNKDLEDVDNDVLEAMQDNGKVTVYFSFDDEVLFIDGEADEVASNYVMVKEDTKLFTNRAEKTMTLDVLNDKGNVVEYSVKLKDINDKDEDYLYSSSTVKVDGEDVSKTWVDTVKEGNVLKITLDSKGKLTKVEAVDKSKDISENKVIKTGDKFAEGFKLQGKALVFWRDGEKKVKDYSVLTWDQADKNFKEIQKGRVFADDQGRVVAIFADETDNDDDTRSIVGVLRNVQERSDKERYELEIEVNGKETIYEGKKDNLQSLSTLKDEINKVVELKIGEKDDEVKKVVLNKDTDKVSGIAVRPTSNRITIDGKEYRVEGKYYDDKSREREDIAAKDVEGKNVTLYMEPGSSVYVQVVVLNDSGTNNAERDSLEIAYQKGSTIYLVINDRDYEYGGAQTLSELKALEGKIVEYTQRNGVITSIKEKDESSLDKAKAALDTELDRLKSLELDADKYTADSIKAVENAIAKLEGLKNSTDVDAINSAVESVTGVGLVEKGQSEDKITLVDHNVTEFMAGSYIVIVKFDVEDSNAGTVVKAKANDANLAKIEAPTDSQYQFEGVVDGNVTSVTVNVDGTDYVIDLTK